MPTITTILPTYRRPELLARAIESIQAQSWKDVSIVVRDNDALGNTAPPGTIEADPRIRYVRNSANIGAHENFRIGIRNVETDFFSLLSDDDFLEPEFYSNAMAIFDQFPSAAFVAFRVDLVDAGGRFLATNYPGYRRSDAVSTRYFEPTEGFDGFMRGLFPCTWTGFVFKKLVSQAIDLGDSIETGPGADVRFIWRAASRFPFVITNLKGANFSVHSGSYSEDSVFDERFQYWLRQRFLAIKEDPEVSGELKSRLEGHYAARSATSIASLKYYSVHAARLIARRIKAGEHEDLKFDLHAMKHFLPLGFPQGIRMLVALALQLRLEQGIRRYLMRRQ